MITIDKLRSMSINEMVVLYEEKTNTRVPVEIQLRLTHLQKHGKLTDELLESFLEQINNDTDR